MKYYFALFLSMLALSHSILATAAYSPYCAGTKVNNAEDAVIQRLVPLFGMTMGCQVGENCLRKFDVKGNQEKFSIAWKKACGPTIQGIKQLGDQGRGSTFLCKTNPRGSVCCSPEGYERLNKFKLCSDQIIKKKTHHQTHS